eukprot:scaffold21360_cov65-Phaeocystis_antarctica.AAC.5
MLTPIGQRGVSLCCTVTPPTGACQPPPRLPPAGPPCARWRPGAWPHGASPHAPCRRAARAPVASPYRGGSLRRACPASPRARVAVAQRLPPRLEPLLLIQLPRLLQLAHVLQQPAQVVEQRTPPPLSRRQPPQRRPPLSDQGLAQQADN